MELLAEINKAIRKAAKKDSSDFLYAYLRSERTILSIFERFQGVKSEIYLQNIDGSLDEYLGFSSLFSDITLLNTAPSATQPSHITYLTPGHPNYKERKIDIPIGYIRETGVDPKNLLPCYFHRNNDDTKRP